MKKIFILLILISLSCSKEDDGPDCEWVVTGMSNGKITITNGEQIIEDMPVSEEVYNYYIESESVCWEGEDVTN